MMQSDLPTPDLDFQDLFEAARTGELSVCQALLAQGREHRSSSPLTSSVLAPSLATAISSKHLHVVALLLEQGAVISGNDMILALGDTDASIAMFQTFLDHGWDINSQTDLGNVMLKYVVGNERLTRWFLKNGAKANFGKLGSTLLDVAAANATTEVFDLLVAHGARTEDSDALHSAAGEREDKPGRVTMFTHLLDMGFNVNAIARRDYPPGRRIGRGTPLHAAMAPQQTDRIELLLLRGADIRVENTLGQTPLDYAVSKGFQRSESFLRSAMGLEDSKSSATIP